MTIVEVAGHSIKLSNLDKVLYREDGFTKGQVIDYYARIAEVAVPHYAGRCMTLKRYPDGPDGKYFFEKNAPSHTPGWVTTFPVWSGHSKRAVNFVVVDSPATVVWTANLAALELHPSLAKVPDIQRPTMVVFDLDPGPPATVVECCNVALLLRDIFDHLGIESYAKTSGSKGLQLYVPLNRQEATYDGDGDSVGTKGFALAIAQLLEKERADLVTSNMAKDVRGGKVFVDWSQNDEHKTTVGVYSLRARARPTVSTPVQWDEVKACAQGEEPLVFLADDVIDRLDRLGDLFAPTLIVEQSLPHLS